MTREGAVSVEAPPARVTGDLSLPDGARGLVIFAHGSGSSRFSPRNRRVARSLQAAGLGTLLLDLLTRDEEAVDELTREHRFDIGLLAARLKAVADFVRRYGPTRELPLGYFGASTGAAAALVAAADDPRIGAVVSRGGRPDLAGPELTRVRAATLLIVGGDDHPRVLAWNRESLDRLSCVKEMRIVPGATHLFEEPGALEQVTELSAGWFSRHLGVIPIG